MNHLAQSRLFSVVRFVTFGTFVYLGWTVVSAIVSLNG